MPEFHDILTKSRKKNRYMMIFYPGDLSSEKKEKILTLLGSHTIKAADDSMLEETMKEVLENAKEEFPENTQSKRAFLYLEGMDRDEMSAVHDLLVENGLSVLIAASTNDNLGWKLQDLLSELEREDAWFEAHKELGKLLEDVKDSPYAHDPAYQQGVMMAVYAWKQDEAPVELLQAAVQFLKNPQGE
jgi:hypothetical protein